MRRIIFLLVFCTLLISPSYAQVSELSEFTEQLESVTDSRLRQVLKNGIYTGLIQSPGEFDRTVERYERSINSGSDEIISLRTDDRWDIDAIREEIRLLCAPVSGLDKDFVYVTKTEQFRSGGYLFEDLHGKLPESYQRTYELCKIFDPVAGQFQAPELDDEINEYLEFISDDPVIKYALEATDSTIEDLKENWFNTGLGFQHVFAGEIRNTRIGGYHWWYMFYRDERSGFAQVDKIVADKGNPNVFTGSFYWSPDGDGPLPTGYKPIGGFLLHNSAQAMLALGHIAIEVTKKHGRVPNSLRFRADINGEEFTWQLYTRDGNIRTFFPLGNSSTLVNPHNESDEYYFKELEH